MINFLGPVLTGTQFIWNWMDFPGITTLENQRPSAEDAACVRGARHPDSSAAREELWSRLPGQGALPGEG